MSVSRKIVDLWNACGSAEPRVDVFDAADEKAMQSLSEYGLVYELLESYSDNPHAAIVLALRALAIHKSELADKLHETELAVTAPPSTSSTARPTLFVIREMIESAQREVLLVGYRITNKEILQMLWTASKRGIKVVLVCDRKDGDAKSIRQSWPAAVPAPTIHEDITLPDGDYKKMHIKALVVDSTQLLVSSANFTQLGMDGNIEFGLRTTGKPASDAKTILMQLIRSDLFQELSD